LKLARSLRQILVARDVVAIEYRARLVVTMLGRIAEQIVKGPAQPAGYSEGW
jgi:hypothetical protein